MRRRREGPSAERREGVQIDRLGVDAILIGTSERGMLWKMLRGNVLSRFSSRVPARTRLVIVG